jgi:hypothetical protein
VISSVTAPRVSWRLSRRTRQRSRWSGYNLVSDSNRKIELLFGFDSLNESCHPLATHSLSTFFIAYICGIFVVQGTGVVLVSRGQSRPSSLSRSSRRVWCATSSLSTVVARATTATSASASSATWLSRRASSPLPGPMRPTRLVITDQSGSQEDGVLSGPARGRAARVVMSVPPIRARRTDVHLLGAWGAVDE